MDKASLSTEELPLVYVRHIMDARPYMFEKWLDKRLAVIHYEGDILSKDKMTVDPKDFKGSGRKVMLRLSYYCQSGALVVADYNDYGFKVMLLGVLRPNSKIEPRVEQIEVSQHYPEGLAYYHVVKLNRCVRLDHSDPLARPLLVLQPRQNNVVNWRIGNIAEYVRYLHESLLSGSVSMSNLPIEKYPLTDYQWEVLCSEYLRIIPPSEGKIDYLLTPVGRTMKDIDIEGANREAHILAQVSLTTKPDEIDSKILSLRSYLDESKFTAKKTALVYFGPEDLKQYVESKYEDIKFISVKQVFEELKKTGIIDDMLPSRRYFSCG